jgi:LuxR family transcriptional regulator, maltose regulon positive regulatory protein
MNLFKTKQQKMPFRLTMSQMTVLETLLEGKSTAQIAKEKNISKNTVNTHIKAIYAEMDVNSRPQAVKKAIDKGII